jgi:hypothetical protein
MLKCKHLDKTRLVTKPTGELKALIVKDIPMPRDPSSAWELYHNMFAFATANPDIILCKHEYLENYEDTLNGERLYLQDGDIYDNIPDGYGVLDYSNNTRVRNVIRDGGFLPLYCVCYTDRTDGEYDEDEEEWIEEPEEYDTITLYCFCPKDYTMYSISISWGDIHVDSGGSHDPFIPTLAYLGVTLNELLKIRKRLDLTTNQKLSLLQEVITSCQQPKAT